MRYLPLAILLCACRADRWELGYTRGLGELDGAGGKDLAIDSEWDAVTVGVSGPLFPDTPSERPPRAPSPQTLCAAPQEEQSSAGRLDQSGLDPRLEAILGALLGAGSILGGQRGVAAYKRRKGRRSASF